MQNSLSFQNILRVILKYKIPLAIIAIIAGIVAVIFSGESYLKPRFKSSAAVYPINLGTLSDESETEHMMQMFDNENIRKNIIAKFNLADRYEISEDDGNYLFAVNKVYNERVSISPTRYESVEIVCQDEDPAIAKEMVEEVINQYSINARKIDQDLHKEYHKMLTAELKHQQHWLDSLGVIIQEIKERTGIIEYDLQVERITEGYMKLLEKNISGERKRELEKLMDGFRTEGNNLKNITWLSNNISINMQKTIAKLNMEYSLSKRELSYTHVIKRPEVTDKKHWPVRWLILVISVFTSLLAGIIFFLFLDKK